MQFTEGIMFNRPTFLSAHNTSLCPKSDLRDGLKALIFHTLALMAHVHLSLSSLKSADCACFRGESPHAGLIQAFERVQFQVWSRRPSIMINDGLSLTFSWLKENLCLIRKS